MTRYTDWEAKLSNFFAERDGQPFAYGTNDCCLFACDAALAISGVDLAASFRGTYTDQASAATAIANFTNGGTLADLAAKVAEQNSITEVQPLFAQRGDIVVVVDPDQGPALAVVGMDGWSVVGPGERTYVLSDVVKAWRI